MTERGASEGRGAAMWAGFGAFFLLGILAGTQIHLPWSAPPRPSPSPRSIVGVWEFVNGDGHMSFREDGSFTYQTPGSGQQGEYSVDGREIIMAWGGQLVQRCPFEFRGRILTIRIGHRELLLERLAP